jgi:hypothetical protein
MKKDLIILHVVIVRSAKQSAIQPHDSRVKLHLRLRVPKCPGISTIKQAAHDQAAKDLRSFV